MLATVVDIGAKTDYDALDPDVESSMLSWRPDARGFNKRTVFQYSGACYQCHLKLIWKPRSIGYRGHVKQSVFGTSRQVSAVLGVI